MARKLKTNVFYLMLVYFASMQSTLANENLQLTPFNAQYIAYRSGTDVGDAFLKLVNTRNNQYELNYNSKVSRFFLSDKRFEKTLFYTFEHQLVPISYHYMRTGTGPDDELDITFNQDSKTIIVGGEKTLPWNGELDNQLFRIDLPEKLKAGIKVVEYDFINYRGEHRTYKLEVIASDNLTLPYGQLMALKVKINRTSKSRVTYAWFAPSLNYSLVRLQQFKDGKEQGDMQLSKFTYL